MTLQDEFKSYGDWKTQFIIAGEKYGGPHSYEGDPRIRDFYSWCPDHRRILELGSCEGGHTALLAPHCDSIHCIEGKEYLVKRARFIAQVMGFNNVTFEQHDFETWSLLNLKPRTFDVIFCSGLLYHLSRPWELLAHCHYLSHQLYLATHYTETNEQKYPHDGKFVPDGGSDAWSGMTPNAFWFTLPGLISCLEDCGYEVAWKNDWKKFGPSPYPMVSLFCRSKIYA